MFTFVEIVQCLTLSDVLQAGDSSDTNWTAGDRSTAPLRANLYISKMACLIQNVVTELTSCGGGGGGGGFTGRTFYRKQNAIFTQHCANPIL
jgi:hypothetical protein